MLHISAYMLLVIQFFLASGWYLGDVRPCEWIRVRKLGVQSSEVVGLTGDGPVLPSSQYVVISPLPCRKRVLK